MSEFKRGIIALIIVLVASVSCSAAEKEWTFMVFLNADNNLDSCGVDDQEEMAAVGSNDWLNIVTLIDRENGPASLNYIEKGNVKKIQDMGEVDMGDWNQLCRFVADTAAAFPARHYALVIWNHGSGWNKAKAPSKGISYDDQSGNNITTAQLGLALSTINGTLGKKLDLLCMDACLMQMFEVAWAVRENCDYIVASEETEPGDGYPYDLLLGRLNETSTPEEFARIIVKAYAESYNKPDDDSGGWDRDSLARSGKTTQSALRADRLGQAKAALDEFAETAIALSDGVAMKTAMTEAQRFYYYSNMDLVHFLRLLAKATQNSELQEKAKKADAAISAAIVENATTGSNPTDDGGWGDYDPDKARAIDACGLAVYFPASADSFEDAYSDLAFAKESKWDEMVQDFFRKTMIPRIVADTAAGKLDELRSFAQKATRSDREIALRLVTAINFSMFSESWVRRADSTEIRSLVEKILENSRRPAGAEALQREP